MINKDVIIIGVLDNPFSSNVQIANSFINKYNFNVIPINYRTIIQKFGSKFFENLIINMAKKYNPYLTIFCKCNGINPNIVSECNKFSKTWLWFMDSHIMAKKLPEVIEHAKRTTFSSCTSQIAVDLFKDKGAKNCYHIFEGANPNIFKPVESVKELKADISFLGTRTSERDRYKKLLEDAKYNVKFYGQGYPNGYGNWSQVCSSSKFMLSLNTFNNISGYFSGRVIETLACEVCTFHLDTTNTLNTFFEDGKEIVYFKDERDLLSKLKSIDAITAKRIAINGRKRVIKEYTWDHSVSKIIDIVEKNK